jgi:PBSX family phage terminase large subunit
VASPSSQGRSQYLKVGTNTHWLFGATTEASQDVVQGLTAAGALLDDAALFPESFIQQAKARCSVDGAKMWLNCNPEGPFHWMKKEYIDQAEATRTLVLHFLMSDNLSLSDAVRARYERMFKGVWHKRFIQGLWVMAEGAVYDMWDSVKHMRSETPFPPVRQIASVDYATSSVFVAGLYDVSKPSDKRAHKVRELRYDAVKEKRQKTDSQLADDFVQFIGNDNPTVVYVDPSAASFKAELGGRGFVVMDGNNDVIDGIRLVSSMLAQEAYTVDPSCTYTDQCYSSYVWDIKAQRRGEDKPLKVNDHECDADRYAINTYFGQPSLFGETDI